MTVLQYKKNKAVTSTLETNKSKGVIETLATGAGTFITSSAQALLSSETHLTVIGKDDDGAGSTAAFYRYGEVIVSSVDGMLSECIKSSASSSLSSLTFIGHLDIDPSYSGLNTGQKESLSRQQKIGYLGFDVGSDFVSMQSFLQFKPKFESLSNYFTEDAYFHLAACKIGHHTALLEVIAKACDIPVYAGLGNENASGYNLGSYIAVFPDGNTKKFSNRTQIGSFN